MPVNGIIGCRKATISNFGVKPKYIECERRANIYRVAERNISTLFRRYST